MYTQIIYLTLTLTYLDFSESFASKFSKFYCTVFTLIRKGANLAFFCKKRIYIYQLYVQCTRKVHHVIMQNC